MRVLAGGCFNSIHWGHIYFLTTAKQIADELVVVLAHDFNNRKKNIYPANVRLSNLRRLKIADQVIVGDKKDFTKTIRKVRPDLVILGYDQTLSLALRSYLKKQGIAWRQTGRLPGYHKKNNEILGVVSSGMGEGNLFMSLNGYSRQIVPIIKKMPYPGTLNISLGLSDASKILAKQKFFTIQGFAKGGKRYGPAELYPVQLILRNLPFNFTGKEFNKKKEFLSGKKEIPAWIVRPAYTRHPAYVVELVHWRNLRKALGLAEGQIVGLAFKKTVV